MRPVALAVLTGCVAGAPPTSPATSPAIAVGTPGIRVEPASLEFGRLARGDAAEQVVVVDNPGDAVLHVSEVVVTAGEPAFSVPLDGFELDPGEAAELPVTFSPAGADENFGRISIFSDAAESEIEVPVVGYGAMPELVATPEEFVFADAFVPCAAAVEVALANVGLDPLVVAGLDLESAGLLRLDRTSVPALPFTLAPGASTTVRVVFTALQAGADTAALTVASNDPGGSKVVRLNGEAGFERRRDETFAAVGGATFELAEEPWPGSLVVVVNGTPTRDVTVAGRSVTIGSPALAVGDLVEVEYGEAAASCTPVGPR